jgi:hypothetical protein
MITLPSFFLIFPSNQFNWYKDGDLDTTRFKIFMLYILAVVFLLFWLVGYLIWFKDQDPLAVW